MVLQYSTAEANTKPQTLGSSLKLQECIDDYPTTLKPMAHSRACKAHLSLEKLGEVTLLKSILISKNLPPLVISDV